MTKQSTSHPTLPLSSERKGGGGEVFLKASSGTMLLFPLPYPSWRSQVTSYKVEQAKVVRQARNPSLAHLQPDKDLSQNLAEGEPGAPGFLEKAGCGGGVCVDLDTQPQDLTALLLSPLYHSYSYQKGLLWL